MSAQVCMRILQKIQLIHQTEFSIGIKDVNDLDHIPQDEETLGERGMNQFGQHLYYPTVVVYVNL